MGGRKNVREALKAQGEFRSKPTIYSINLAFGQVPTKKAMPSLAFYGAIYGKDSDAKGFPGGSDGKEPTCNSGDASSIPGSGRSLGGGQSNPLRFLPGETR